MHLFVHAGLRVSLLAVNDVVNRSAGIHPLPVANNRMRWSVTVSLQNW